MKEEFLRNKEVGVILGEDGFMKGKKELLIILWDMNLMFVKRMVYVGWWY